MNSVTNLANLRYLEQLYESYRKNPASVDRTWQHYFNELAHDLPGSSNGGKSEARQKGSEDAPRADSYLSSTLQDQVNELVRSFRALGHRAAQLDPLDLRNTDEPSLDPAYHGLMPERMDQLFPCVGLQWPGPLTLREIVDRLRRSYSGPVAIEFMHVEDHAARQWLIRRIESDETHFKPGVAEQQSILTELIHAREFDQFIRSRFVGAKSFSLEGGESLNVLLHFAMEKSAQDGVREIVLAMAHRGRLNVLVNVLGKKHRDVFREFIDAPDGKDGGGDVKYHLGHSSDFHSAAGPALHLSLCFNPSHLEFVSAVALGRARAKQDRSNDTKRERGMALLIHGDAAFIGEGISQETLNLSELVPYRVGGTLHVIVNNQIGFTTCPQETRSSRYASDIGKMLQIPILHVNGDDPEAVQRAVTMALDFRRRFKRDVVVDMICYRRHGHNEGDEPSFTQPKLYRAISRHAPVDEIYLKQLIDRKVATPADAEQIARAYRALLENELAIAGSASVDSAAQSLGGSGIWSSYSGGLEPAGDSPTTGISPERSARLLDVQTHFPADFHPHPKILRAVAFRREMATGKRPLDWAAAEALAFASLAADGMPIRLSGQDTARGTFSQRHAVLHDIEDGREYVPLQHISTKQAAVEIYNSPLSEAGVLGFEYGFSLDYPEALVLWEAQFGDFVNAAQVIVDQFIASAEEKWRRLSGLVLLLPHGMEGMGPEHSSARLERFLQLCARDNLQIVYPTTPAQYFHCLRRQALRKWRKPLVIMTPKSLLRHPAAVSSLSEFSDARFEGVRGEPGANGARRVLLCSGKLYYDLKRYREENKRDDVAILRIEQLYPTPTDALRNALAPFPKATPVVWVQEEPINMGAACFLSLQFGTQLFDRWAFSTVARPAAASPATGSATRHADQQAKLLAAAFAEAR
jgi:2-oxoglutarate dehydrogenase E1 component